MRLPFAREIIGLLIFAAALGGLWLWQQQQSAPYPPDATVLDQSINSMTARVTTLQGTWSIEEVRAFYQRSLPERGWRYCGNQATPGCTNLFNAVPLTEAEIDVYRQSDDQTQTGRTIEIWPQPGPDGTRVRLFESQAPQGLPQ